MQVQHSDKRVSLRQFYRRKRKAISPSLHTKYASQIVNACIDHKLLNKPSAPEIQQHKLVDKVALYLSFDGELNTQALIHYLWSQSIKVYLPVLHPFSKGHLLFLRYTPDSKMTSNRFGIAEPILDVQNVCPLMQLDLIFTPLVAFDKKGNRLGMGGGFYDRTLATVLTSQDNKPLLVGVAHEGQKADLLSCENWDIPMQSVLTPERLYWF